jgi:RibD C-terminal domain
MTVAEPFGSDGRPSWVTAGAMVADQEPRAGVGATVMGCNIFGVGSASGARIGLDGLVGRGPPFHAPVFVSPATPASRWRWRHHLLSRHRRCQGPFEQVRQAAGGRDVLLAGGASVVQQYLAAGLVDEFWLHLVPVLLSAGAAAAERRQPQRRAGSAIEAPSVTHIKYRVINGRKGHRPTEHRPFRRQARQKPPFRGCAPDGNPMLHGPQQARTSTPRVMLHACQHHTRPSTRAGCPPATWRRWATEPGVGVPVSPWRWARWWSPGR